MWPEIGESIFGNIEISVALITYNGEKYICEQLDSILNQTFQHFEIVVCDDLSTDSTLDILNKYAQMDNRIKIYKNEKNLGFLKNIEKAIGLCNGQFIALADQDDVWEKEHLEILYSNIGESFLACADTLFVNKDNNSLGVKLSQLYKGDISLLKNSSEHFLMLLVMRNVYQGAAMMLNRKFTSIALPFPDGIEFHDVWFALCAMALDKFIYIPTVIIRHRKHSKNVTGHFLYPKDAYFWNKIEYINPLNKLLNLNDNGKKTIKQSQDFFLNKKKLLKYHKAMMFWFREYRILYVTNNKNRFLIRFLNSFFYVPLIGVLCRLLKH